MSGSAGTPGVRAAWGRWCRFAESRRAGMVAGLVLGVAAVAYFVLCLYLARNVTFTVDELLYFAEDGGFAPRELAEPFGGHLTATTRAIYAGGLELFGPEHLPFQVVTLLTIVAVAALLFLLIRPWVGPLAALGPALIVLFLGSTPTSIQGNATMWAHSTAFGLAAMLAFDRGGRRGDALACAMLVLAVLSLEVGIAFALGIALWALARRQPRRLWVAAVPLAIYAAWWLWALKFDEGVTTASNVLLIPAYTAEWLAAAAAAVSGLAVEFGELSLESVESPWGPVVLVALAGLGVLGIRRRGRVDAALWAALGATVALGIAGAMAYGPLRTPDAARYLFPPAVLLLVMVAACWRGQRPGPGALAAMLGLTALVLPANIWLLRERGNELRSLSDRTVATLAVLEAQGEAVVPAGLIVGLRVPFQSRLYFDGVERHGSPIAGRDPIPELPASAREAADETLGMVLVPRLSPLLGDPKLSCIAPVEGGPVRLGADPSRVAIRSVEGGAVLLARYGDRPTIPAGTLPPGVAARIAVAADGPWTAALDGGGMLELCRPTGGLPLPPSPEPSTPPAG